MKSKNFGLLARYTYYTIKNLKINIDQNSLWPIKINSDCLAFHGFISNIGHEESAFSQKSGVVVLGIASWNIRKHDVWVRVVIDAFFVSNIIVTFREKIDF